MRRQGEFYSSMQDAEKVQLCASTIHPSIYRSALLISARPDQDSHRERECRQHKPSRIGDVQASVTGFSEANAVSLPPTDSVAELRNQMQQLREEVQRLALSRREMPYPKKLRSRSASRTRTPVERHKPRNCWHHWRFGDRASICVTPCNFSGKLKQSSVMTAKGDFQKVDRLFLADHKSGLRFLVDSGASVSCVPAKIYHGRRSSNFMLSAANSTRIPYLRRSLLQLNYLRPATTSTLTPLQMTIVFLHFSPLLRDTPCLPSDSSVSSAQILLQLIKVWYPVTLLPLPQRSIVLCTCLPADSSPSTTVPRIQTCLSHGNCIRLIVISTSEIHLPHVCHASKHASWGACSPNELRFPSTIRPSIQIY
ncbi:hypothetical protein AVEN_205368-1 [Araneus ventricosus]|uniref:Peptidase A2 domain-containing protein n=1 Tax=Araneus ventricosus TaxID=182803 RepID=A0A4Y2HHI2_ARAVE|nr:hypothetical protein AVEN_265592-1 [Araneus ventricosus]GBM64729.1 hypothetical protein AVEN_205368-1 [Araneus ventricosus]